MRLLNYCLNNIQKWLFPTHCCLCGTACAPDLALCAGCEADLPYLKEQCPGCALPSPAQSLCGRCQQRASGFDQAFALLRYAPPVARLLWQLKYHGHLHHAPLLGQLLARGLADSLLPRPDCIMPVPLHPRRLRTREYNQALEIARPVAQTLHIPLDYVSLRRVRATPSQTRLTREARARNVRRAFVANRDLTGAHIALVDDIMTSGHTARALALCLRQAGAARVQIWVVARA